ncbi:indolepyruvate ferredoxin oxidoreductase subunit alpha [Pseudonocardia thermophila]|uniref:indolepyruvate ferredoxin oxidoreductase subunit alpha n=1 Tax=Pseudonocardia thermophila TaxID=1848 RepID=UPI00248EDA08|nr:ferredoxin family protein [Pseudonocardia thermophila]
MTYVIGGNCIDVTDRACMGVCPVDCIYMGRRKCYINPNECIECGACEPECPVDAIFLDRAGESDPAKAIHVEDTERFFAEPLPGRGEPLGDPGGATAIGELGVDTPFVAEHSAR